MEVGFTGTLTSPNAIVCTIFLRFTFTTDYTSIMSIPTLYDSQYSYMRISQSRLFKTMAHHT